MYAPLRSLPTSALSILIFGALGCAAQAPAQSSASTAGVDGAEAEKKSALDAAKVRPELLSATVYDALGQALVCAPPKDEAQCAGTEINRDLRDTCKRLGFNVRRCGCDLLCAGNIAAHGGTSFYDAAGGARTCAKEEPDCSPPPPSTAFQDACNDKGFRLQICGCEWLCSGKPDAGR